MTTVVYSPADGLVSLRGHAGAGEKGRDPVCAAVSILMYTLAALPGAKLHLGEGWAVVELAGGAPQKQAPGGRPARRPASPDPAPWGGPQIGPQPGAGNADAICLGFRLLAAAYPQNVRYKEVKP